MPFIPPTVPGIPHLFADGDISGSGLTFLFSAVAGFYAVVTSIDVSAADSGLAVFYIHESGSTHAKWNQVLTQDPLSVVSSWTWDGYQVLQDGAIYSGSWFPSTQFGHVSVSGLLISK